MDGGIQRRKISQGQGIQTTVTASNQIKRRVLIAAQPAAAASPTIAKAIASQVHVSLANASTIAEKAAGPNTHAVAVRIGVVHGFLV